MPIQKKTKKIFSCIFLIAFFFSYWLYGAGLKKNISPEEALAIRHKQGECWISYGKDTWCKSMIISYLYSEKISTYHIKERSNILKKCSSWGALGFLSKKSILLNEKSNQIIKNSNDPNNYISLSNEYQSSFDNFIHNMGLDSKKTIHQKAQVIANALNTEIKFYRPSKDDSSKLSQYENITPKKNSKYLPIRIVNDAYVHAKEQNQEYKKNSYIRHYRPLLTAPKDWVTQTKNINLKKSSKIHTNKTNIQHTNNKQATSIRFSSSQGAQFSTFVSNSKPNPQSNQNNRRTNNLQANFDQYLNGLSSKIDPLYIPEVAEKELKNKKEKQVAFLEKVSKDLKNLLDNTVRNVQNGLRNYNINQVRKWIHIYEEAEKAELIDYLNSIHNRSWPSLDNLIKKITIINDKTINYIKKLDFTSKEYQNQSRSNKEKFFELLNQMIVFALGSNQQWSSSMNINLSVKKEIENKIKQLEKEVIEILEKSVIKEKFNEKLNTLFQTNEMFYKYIDSKELNKEKERLKNCKKRCIHGLNKKAGDILKKSTTLFDNKLEELSHLLIDASTLEQNLDRVYIEDTMLDGLVDQILKKFKKQHRDESVIKLNMLSACLQKTGKGRRIVDKHAVFRGTSIMLRNQAFSSKSAQAILKDIREYKSGGQNNQKKSTIALSCLNEIQELYEQFEKKYWKLVESNLANQNAIYHIASKLKKYQRKDSAKIEWDDRIRKSIIHIIAHVFAYWTLRSIQYYKEAQGIKNRKEYLLQPHPAQVIAIMRILGLGEDGKLRNNLIQIGTGEGKSLIAFATCVALALLGFDISCVCYSEYLSLRDHNEFMPIIKELGLNKYIRYTTFNNLCEAIINEKGDIRDKLVNLINITSGQGSQNSSRSRFKFSAGRARIIFIDEVDVFFSKDFYGSPYSPTALLKHSSIEKLLEFVWDNRDMIYYQKVKSCDCYKECINTFRNWEPIINEAIRNMINDVKSYESPSYTIYNNNLCYKDSSGISSKVNYQYKTVFACLHEQENITKESLRSRLGIYLNCGLFSYAEIPSGFDKILGVTGTLDTLGPLELSILRKSYNIKKYTYMPSLYGKSKRSFLKKQGGVTIVKRNLYPTYLKELINESLESILKIPNQQRAVIVFFETPEKLNELYFHPNMIRLKDNIMIMKSDLSFEEKNRRISKATTQGNITFCIREFGRGTDFVCYDPVVNKNGGVHVIITFFPESISEETQIVGRTARQANRGSISMLLEEESLEALISAEKIEEIREKSKDFYSPLNEKRNNLFHSSYNTSIEYVKKVRKEHKKAMNFTNNLFKNNTKEVIDHLLVYNKAPGVDVTYTILLVDATLSMGNLLLKTKKTIRVMFERINQVLEKKGKSSAFALQLAAYRNYNAPPDMILQVSPWVSRAENLVQFMDTVTPQYGWGNEAIEIGLAHVLREQETRAICQVILIGDMPPNTIDNISYKRSESSTKWEAEAPFFSSPIYYEDKLDEIKNKGIPIHAFHVPLPGSDQSNPETEKIFTQIAQATGGICELLNIHSEQGATQLENIVSVKVLKETAGPEAVKLYIEMFGGKSYL